jgi:hypothetical protein
MTLPVTIKQDLNRILKDSTVVQERTIPYVTGNVALEIRKFENNNGGLLCRFIIDDDTSVIPLSYEISRHLCHKFSEYVPVECTVSVGENRVKDYNAYVLVYFTDVEGIVNSLDKMTRDVLVSIVDGIKSYYQRSNTGYKHRKTLCQIYDKITNIHSSYKERIGYKLRPDTKHYPI